MIPGGVNSSIRAFKSVGGTPYIVDRAEGPYVWDVEGPRYIDLVQSYGAVILGHAHPASPRPSTAAAARRHVVRRADAGRDAARRGHPDAGAELRHGAADELGTEATSTAVGSPAATPVATAW